MDLSSFSDALNWVNRAFQIKGQEAKIYWKGGTLYYIVIQKHFQVLYLLSLGTNKNGKTTLEANCSLESF